MKKILKIWLAVSAAGILISLLLLAELLSHDPYQWLKPRFDGVESRDLWNERKKLYIYILVGFSAVFFSSLAYLIYQKMRVKQIR
jgi:hypothetical protein